MTSYDWKQLRMAISTGAATFGIIVPATMHIEMKEIVYTNLTNANNEVILRQIPSGNIRPASACILDDQQIAANSPYSPRIPIRIMQENTVMEASSSAGPINVTLAYKLRYGRP
jgi:hypothetical protein